MMRIRVVICVLALVSTLACGSRVSHDEIVAASAQQQGGGDGGGGSAATTGGNGTGADGRIGDLEVGCGEGDASGATDTGVADDRIGIGVISDKAGIVQVPTVGIEESVKAFVAYCNSLGGINGRELELTAYDSKLGAHAEATQQACGNDDIFALVGSGSVLDDQGAQVLVDCGLVEVAGYAASAKKGLSERVFTSVPNPQDQFNLGACTYIAEQFPDAVEKAAVIYSDIGAAKNRGQTIVEGCEQAGFDFVYEKGVAIGEQNWGSTVSEMQSEGVEYLNVVTAVPELQNLLVAMQDQNYKPEVIDLGQQYYDPAVLESPGSEGAYVLTNTVPFEETEQSPALQVYRHWLEEAAPGVAPTSLGVQAFSAGLLFAQAMKALGSDVTRDALIESLSAITEWDGGGLHMVTNPGENEMNGCFLYLRVNDAQFERLHPEEGFECDPSANIELEGDYGTGARAGG